MDTTPSLGTADTIIT